MVTYSHEPTFSETGEYFEI